MNNQTTFNSSIVLIPNLNSFGLVFFKHMDPLPFKYGIPFAPTRPIEDFF